MKNKFFDKVCGVLRFLGSMFGHLWRLCSKNLGLKLLSLLMAILLWHFVVTTNTSITRTKSVTGLTGYISGQSTLNTYGLALLENPTEELSDISVLIEVSQSDYAYPSEDNVQVTLDLSSVRTAGVQEVPLKASSAYGKVVRIMPDSVSMTFEPLDSRIVPVNVQITGDDGKSRWYNVNRSNPSSLTISGAASVVQKIASAYVYVDAAGAENSFTAAEEYTLMDGAGNLISQSMLNRSASSISVNVGVYPTKEIPISTEISSVVMGEPAEGYIVDSISIQPQTISVAAEQELLDRLEELRIQPISVEGRSQSFSARADVATLTAFRNLSAEEVFVNINIVEETIGAWIDDVKISYAGKSESMTLSAPESVRVYITGPRSDVEALQETGFAATVDLTGLSAGAHNLQILFPSETCPEITFTPEMSEAEVVLAEAESEAD